MADPILKTYASLAAQHLERAATNLALRQLGGQAGIVVPLGSAAGNVPPWAGSDDLDFHGTLAAIWVWARHQSLAGHGRFEPNRRAAWSFVEGLWRSFIPEAIGPEASDEAAFDCALVLRAALAEGVVPGAKEGRAGLVAGAARVIAAYLSELDELSGRDFQDPGFLAWNLIEYARAVEDRGLLSAGRRFVERAFGMKAPPRFETEPESAGGLFDFSSTTAMRVMAIVACEGHTPFVGAWLRERVAPAVPKAFVTRARDENCWNACVAAVIGRAYVVSTDPVLLDAYRAICGEIARRDADGDAALGREGAGDGAADTLATFYYALAADALVRAEASVETLRRNVDGRR